MTAIIHEITVITVTTVMGQLAAIILDFTVITVTASFWRVFGLVP